MHNTVTIFNFKRKVKKFITQSMRFIMYLYILLYYIFIIYILLYIYYIYIYY